MLEKDRKYYYQNRDEINQKSRIYHYENADKYEYLIKFPSYKPVFINNTLVV